MVAHALHEVAYKLTVEVVHGKAEELDEESAYKRYVDLHRYPEQEAPPDEVGDGGAGNYHELPEQDEPYEADIASVDAEVHDGARQEGHDELQGAPRGEGEDDAGELAAMA